MENQYASLINLLQRLTTNGKLFWQKTSSANEYMIELNATSFIISRANSGEINLDMFNDKNIRGSIIKCSTNNSDYSQMHDLYMAAQNYVSKESEIISDAMTELYLLENR